MTNSSDSSRIEQGQRIYKIIRQGQGVVLDAHVHSVVSLLLIFRSEYTHA